MTNCPWCNAILPDNTTPKGFCPACYTSLDSTLPREPFNVPKRKTPVTTALLFINLGVLCAMLISGHSLSISDDQPLRWGADWGPLTLHFQWWRLLTSTFIHLGKEHLANNLLVLWILGKRAERVFGKWRFLTLYIITGAAGSIVSIAVMPERITCGASGGIFGLFGALFMAWCLGKVKLSHRARWGLGIVALLMVYDLYSGFTDSQVANSAHISGIVSGLILGGLMASDRINNPRFLRQVYSGAAMVLLLGITSLQYWDGYLSPLAYVDTEISEKRYDDALAQINTVLEHHPDNVLANTDAAECYFHKHDYARAEAAASRSVETNPDNLFGALILARVYLRTHRVDKARSLAERLLLEKTSDKDRKKLAVVIYQMVTAGENSDPADD